MVITPDAITLKKLSLTKQLFQRAVVQSNSYGATDKMISIIIFDLSIETMLNVIVSSLDSSKTPLDNFVGLLNQVDDALKKSGLNPLSNRTNILRVHQIRNDAQHDARYPNETELMDCQTYTRDFHRNTTKEIWKVDFDKLSLATLVQNLEVKDHLAKAEEALHSHDYDAAVQQSSIGLQTALSKAGVAVVGKHMLFQNDIMVSDIHNGSKPDQDLTRSITRMQRALQFVALGLNYTEYLKFQQIGGYVMFTGGGPVVNNAKPNPTDKEAEFAVAFSIDSVVSIENSVDDLEKPFGKDRIEWIFSG